MGGVEIRIKGLDEAIARYAPVFAGNDGVELADTLGALGVRQTQRRIYSEKTSPAGAAWKPNRQGTSILFASGLLAGSIRHTAAPGAATWGSPLIYAAIHNFGGAIRPREKKALRFPGAPHPVAQVVMPQREYLGLSAENAREMMEMVETYFTGRL